MSEAKRPGRQDGWVVGVGAAEEPRGGRAAEEPRGGRAAEEPRGGRGGRWQRSLRFTGEAG